MSIYPPKSRIWWNEPVGKTELTWILISFLWGVFMFFMMIYWHAFGEQNLSSEAYRVTPEAYAAKTEAMVDQYTQSEDEASGMPVVHPPPGSDVYMFGRLWQWYPILELEKDKTYRLHLSSLDWQHGFSLQPENLNLQVHPGYDMVVTITPDEAGTYSVVCNEYCGFGHHNMVGRIYVVDGTGAAQ